MHTYVCFFILCFSSFASSSFSPRFIARVSASLPLPCSSDPGGAGEGRGSPGSQRDGDRDGVPEKASRRRWAEGGSPPNERLTGRPPLLFASLQFLSKPPVFVCARIPFARGAGTRAGRGSERARGGEGYRKGTGWLGGVVFRLASWDVVLLLPVLGRVTRRDKRIRVKQGHDDEAKRSGRRRDKGNARF